MLEKYFEIRHWFLQAEKKGHRAAPVENTEGAQRAQVVLASILSMAEIPWPIRSRCFFHLPYIKTSGEDLFHDYCNGDF